MIKKLFSLWKYWMFFIAPVQYFSYIDINPSFSKINYFEVKNTTKETTISPLNNSVNLTDVTKNSEEKKGNKFNRSTKIMFFFIVAFLFIVIFCKIYYFFEKIKGCEFSWIIIITLLSSIVLTVLTIFIMWGIITLLM